MKFVPARRVTWAKAATQQLGAGIAAALIRRAAEPDWTGDPRRQRQVRAAAVAATLALALINALSVRGGGGPPYHPATGPERIVAIAAVAPLLLAARAPRLAWRTALLALLIVPLVPAGWWGGWPWGPAQILATLAVFCLAGLGQPRPVLWGMWVLTLVPWWLWLAARLSDLNGPGAATLAFTLVTLVLDGVE